MTKAEKRRQQARTRRRANIRRGMRIALYEVNQALAPLGLKIAFPPGFTEYTVAIAEGGRRDASPEDRVEAVAWHMLDRAAGRVRAERRAAFLRAGALGFGARRSAKLA